MEEDGGGVGSFHTLKSSLISLTLCAEVLKLR